MVAGFGLRLQAWLVRGCWSDAVTGVLGIDRTGLERPGGGGSRLDEPLAYRPQRGLRP